MNILKNSFKKEEEIVSEVEVLEVEPVKNNYPPVVLEIHNEFNTASDKLLAEAEKVIEEVKQYPMEKVSRLEALGFKNTTDTQNTNGIAERLEMSEKDKEFVLKYRREFPLHKFITEEQIEVICKKYNLVFGESKRYTGFMPERNLAEIEAFQKRYPKMGKMGEFSEYSMYGDYQEMVNLSGIDVVLGSDISKLKGNGVDIQQEINKHDGINYYGDIKCSDGVTRSGRVVMNGMKICAPVKDMDMSGMTIEDGYKMKELFIPDPIVVQPVVGGWLILTAWGNEASDPIVVNSINN